MAKILDPDFLTVGGNLFVNTGSKTFELVESGSLIFKDGVTAQAVYSKFIELWTSSSYNRYPFPAYVIGDPRAGQFVWGFDGASYNGWKPANNTTRQAIRDAGWSEYDASGTLNRDYVGIVSLGDVSAGAQIYYQRQTAGSAFDFTFTDEVNEGIQVFGDASNGNFNTKTYFKIFTREYAKTYSSADLTLIGETATGPFKLGLPLTNADDLKIVATDAVVTSSSPYNAINVKYFTGSFKIDVDTVGTARSFGIVVDVGTHSGIDGVTTGGGTTLTTAQGIISASLWTTGSIIIHDGPNKGTYSISGTPTSNVVTITGGTFASATGSQSFTLQRSVPVVATKSQIYTKIQYLLRLNSNINSVTGSVTGKTADQTLTFSGDQLEAGRYIPVNPNAGGTGVYVYGFSQDDATTIDFYDNGGTKRNYPFNSTGQFTFNTFLTTGSNGYYRMYFDILPGTGDDWGESGSITVNDKDGVPIQGTINASTIAWSFAYDSNTQGGRVSGSNAAVKVVAGNPGFGKPVVTNYTITRTVGQNIALTAEQDRAYSNPV
jgi:hypothetical protein